MAGQKRKGRGEDEQEKRGRGDCGLCSTQS